MARIDAKSLSSAPRRCRFALSPASLTVSGGGPRRSPQENWHLTVPDSAPESSSNAAREPRGGHGHSTDRAPRLRVDRKADLTWPTLEPDEEPKERALLLSTEAAIRNSALR